MHPVTLPVWVTNSNSQGSIHHNTLVVHALPIEHCKNIWDYPYCFL